MKPAAIEFDRAKFAAFHRAYRRAKRQHVDEFFFEDGGVFKTVHTGYATVMCAYLMGYYSDKRPRKPVVIKIYPPRKE